MMSRNTDGSRILLVGAEPYRLRVLRLMLARMPVGSHSFSEAANSADALDMLRNERFDLVITEYHLPKVRGDALAAEIKRVSPDTPVILLRTSDFGVFDPPNVMPIVSWKCRGDKKNWKKP